MTTPITTQGAERLNVVLIAAEHLGYPMPVSALLDEGERLTFELSGPDSLALWTEDGLTDRYITEGSDGRPEVWAVVEIADTQVTLRAPGMVAVP